MGEVKKDIKITVIAFVINYLFFYIPVSLYLSYYYGYNFFNLYMFFITCSYIFIVVVKREFLLLHKSYSEGVEMRKLSENEIKQISGGDGNDGQAELIAIGSLAGTFISPGFGSIAGAYIGDKVHSWATTATVSPSMSPSGIGLSSQFGSGRGTSSASSSAGSGS
ncbi:microcin M [Escherichia coli]|uniref:Microcin M n=16 Tax=Enterobacteriaceae TaxID=543 RepID=A0A376MLP5_ECOLX|nr:microcin M [Escherichia coli]